MAAILSVAECEKPLQALFERVTENENFSPVSAPHAPFYISPSNNAHLYHADALELLPTIHDESVDMIFADPPYFLSNGGITCVSGKMTRVDKGNWDKSQGIIDDHQFNLIWLEQCRRILKPDGTIWVTGTHHNIHSVGYAMQSLGYKLLNDIAWHKVNPPPNLSCRYFTHATETVLWAAKSVKSKHTFQYALMKSENGGKQMQSLWHILPAGKSEKRYGKHPTQKPEALLRRIVASSTEPGQLILDPFCGSGTTGVVCANLGRLFVGIEQEQKYLALALQRLDDSVPSTTLTFVFSGKSSAEKPTDAVAPLTWSKVVLDALVSLGGEGNLQEINGVIAQNPKTRANPTWHSTVRRVVRQSPKIAALGRGRYRVAL